MKPDLAMKYLERHGAAVISLALAGWTIAVFWRLHSAEFINYDDPFMIYQNPMVAGGWTTQGFMWGLTTSYFDYWHPLTWWSYMTDCQLFGMAAHRHHLMSLGFHVLSTLAIFGAFRELTGMMMRSAIVAALFALHPMHVESVAWLAERKDVLSMLFWALSLWAYARYVKTLALKSGQSELFFRLCLIFFICGILSKPMVVTLPLVLLLFDYWPLHRFSSANAPGSESGRPGTDSRAAFRSTLISLIREKTAFFALAAFSCVMTYSNMKAAHNIVSAGLVPWSLRLSNVPVSYARYLAKLVWPAGICIYYPLPEYWKTWQVAASVLVVLVISLVAVLSSRQAPYLVTGWFIFLGTLVPTISLVPVGYQAMADRFTYLPYLGLFMAVVWGVAEISARWKFRTVLLSVVTAFVMLGCSLVSWKQVGYWRNDFTLWPHCLKVTSGNFTAEYNYGYALQNTGQFKEAITHYRNALIIRPSYVEANLNLGRALAATGDFREATNYFAKAVEFDPNSSDAHGNYGAALYAVGDFPGAVKECTESVRLNPSDFRSLVYLARALAEENQFDEAVRNYSDALRLSPASPEAHYYLGSEYLKHGMLDEAISNLSEAVRLKPSYTEARTQLDSALEKRSAPKTPANSSNTNN